MKHFLIFTVFLFLIHKQTIAQQPTGWHWVKSVSGNYNTYVNATTTDVYGNVYVTGAYVGTVSFGTTTLSNSTGSGMYLVKYDVSGNVLWAIGATGAMGWGVSTDKNGNVFVTGQFSGSSMIVGNHTLTATTFYNDLFIVKFNPTGNVLWAKSEGGTDSEVGRSISIDNNGNAFITGYFRSASLTIGTYTLINPKPGANNVLVVKYDPNGNVLWAKAAAGGGTNINRWAQGHSISTDANGNAIVTGYFSNSSITFGTYALTGAALFIVKFDTNGSVLWAKSVKSSMGNAVSTDTNGNVFLTGHFTSSSIVFGTYTLSNTNTLTADFFIAKYDTSGSVLWAKAFDGGDGLGICTNNNGNVYVTGYYNETVIVFGTSTLTNNNGGTDMFVAKYDASGNEISAVSAGGSLNENAHGAAIAADGNGNAFVTGTYHSPVVMFDTITLTNANTNYSNAFVGRLVLCEPPADITPTNNKLVCKGSATTLSVSGTGIINWYSSANSTFSLENAYSFVTPNLSVGNYTYYAEANTCTNNIARTAITVTVDACLGLADIANPMTTVSVYPNPFQDKLLIDSGELRIDKLSISNVLGELILQQNNYNTPQLLDLSTLPSGIYFLKVEDKKEQRVVKVIKE